MTLADAKEEFVTAWGGLGSHWGINKTMAGIHALMLVNKDPMSAEDIMEKLQISRGNVNMNVRALVDWNLISRTSVKGERREYFIAEKDPWRMATRIAHERRKRELEPMIKTLDNIRHMEIKTGNKKEIEEFQNFISSLQEFSHKVDNLFTTLTRADQNWFTGTLLKLLK